MHRFVTLYMKFHIIIKACQCTMSVKSHGTSAFALLVCLWKFVLFVGRQAMWTFVFCPPTAYDSSRAVSGQIKSFFVANAQLAWAQHCLWACSSSRITVNTERGGRAAGLLCAHDCTVFWQKESARWETERERVRAVMQHRECRGEKP